MTEKVYVNMETGEITEKHAEAMTWFRAGVNVGIYVGSVCRCTWEH